MSTTHPEFEALGDYREFYDHVRRHLPGITESYLFGDGRAGVPVTQAGAR